MDRLTLLPCPFCGAAAKLKSKPRLAIPNMTYWVGCKTPNCPGDQVWEKIRAEAAVEAWNSRQSLSQEAVRDEVEARPRAEVMHIAFLSKDRTDTEGYFARELVRLADLALKREPNAAATVSAIERSKAVRTCRKCKTSWEASVNFCPQCGGVNDEMVDRFLSWPLPESVCADLCATKQGLGRIGTNLLTATEAKQMLEYVLAHSYKTVPTPAPGASDE